MLMSSESRTQTERVVLTLREMLLRGDFKPGERLTELALVPLLKASRTPVRLALDRLANEGLLEALATTGFRVRAFALADIWDAIDIRGVLEGTAARMAAERLNSADELAALKLHCRQAEELLPMTRDRFVRYIEINEAFHAGVWRLAKSPMLRASIERIVALPFAAPGALVEAIEQREAGRAEALAREHSRLAQRALKRALEYAGSFEKLPGATLVKRPD